MATTKTKIPNIGAALDATTSPVAISEYMTATTVTGDPADSKFYSEIVGRAPLIDPRESVHSKLGIERIRFTGATILRGESGPNGEVVYEFLDGQRIYGTPVAQRTNNGYYIENIASTIEFTFYGTGINILKGYEDGSDRGFVVKVDGNAHSTTTTAGYDNVISERNYDAQMVVPVVSGLTLGVHTVTLDVSVSATHIDGFEILNETASVQQTAGTIYSGAEKYTLADTTDDLTTFTNTTQDGTGDTTKGGHVVWYLDTDGVRKKDIRYSDTDQKDLALADHSNEELVRTFNWREFGSGRSDDFGAVDGSLSDHAFTLDDGTTTLVGDSIRTGNSESDAVILNATGNSCTITFIGTGLDILATADFGALIVDHTVYVDGASIGIIDNTLLPTVGSKVNLSLVSGLPFGTHTVEIEKTGSGTSTLGIFDFIIYAPKKPTLAAGQTELASSYKMADFVANTTASAEAISTGVIRKSSGREGVYSGTWTHAGVNTSFLDGQNVFTSTTTSYVERVIFGTGADIRIDMDAADTATVSIDGSSDLSSFTTAIYGGGGFVSSTGVLTGIFVDNSGLSVSGLTLGLHTIRITKTTGSGGVRLLAADIITPYYNYTADVYDVSNDIIGSNTLKSEITYPGTFKEPIIALSGVEALPKLHLRYGMASDQTLTNNVALIPTLGAIRHDSSNGGDWSALGHLKTPRTGYYAFSTTYRVQDLFDINDTGGVSFQFRYIKNGSEIASKEIYPNTTGVQRVGLSDSRTLYLEKGDTLQLGLFTNMGNGGGPGSFTIEADDDAGGFSVSIDEL